MALAHPENERLLAALRDRDAANVGPALLRATLLVPAVTKEGGEVEPALQRTKQGTLELVAFTDAGKVREWRPEIDHVARILGGDLVNLAIKLGAAVIRLDVGQPHSGFLTRDAINHLAGTLRGAGSAAFDPPGEWATETIAQALRDAVAGDDDLAGAWLADRGRRPSIVLDATGGDPSTVIQRVVEAMRPAVPKGTSIDFVLLDEARRAEAQALGEPLR